MEKEKDVDGRWNWWESEREKIEEEEKNGKSNSK